MRSDAIYHTEKGNETAIVKDRNGDTGMADMWQEKQQGAM